MKDLDEIKEMGFKEIGKYFIKDKKFIIECEEKYLSLEKMIYIHTLEGEILRVGSSKNKLKGRMREWERDVTKSINKQKSGTPLWEGEEWNKVLKNKIGILYGRQGTVLKTPIGLINIYLSEESELIRKYGRMNRDRSRHK